MYFICPNFFHKYIFVKKIILEWKLMNHDLFVKAPIVTSNYTKIIFY